MALGSFSLSAQDIIYKTSGDEVSAKIMEISTTKITFKQPNLFSDSLFTLPHKDVFMVKYANGEKELMQPAVEEAAPEPVKRNPLQMAQLGRLDARKYYKSNKGIAGGAISGFLFFPAALVVAAVPPKITLNDGPDPQLLSNPYYYKGFRSQAHKRKLGKVAIGTGVGLLGLIVFSSLSNGQQ
ncbi:hypothetical protein TH63_06145 [Rufibacter radiotolerans]|uniref:Uncharacterized protein n=1 Tax=Rufibacter radiotolerans TaxID=1379910 RepID=A0A0H4VN69_9BACT|nr:hypothetical protein TH63_06145 [Rufibacter radiotolerans]